MQPAHSGEREQEQFPVLGGPRSLSSLLVSCGLFSARAAPSPPPCAQIRTHPDAGWALCTSPECSLCAVPSAGLSPAFGLWELLCVSAQQRPAASFWVPSLSWAWKLSLGSPLRPPLGSPPWCPGGGSCCSPTK